MCLSPNYGDYPTYGGRWERTNRTHGRVGSAFESVGQPAELLSDSAAAEPTPAEEQYYAPLPEPEEDGPPVPPPAAE